MESPVEPGFGPGVTELIDRLRAVGAGAQFGPEPIRDLLADALAQDTEVDLAVALAQAHCSDLVVLAAEEHLQLHGGIGMTWELPLAHYAKRLVMIDHQLGDEDHHLARYIALGRETSETSEAASA